MRFIIDNALSPRIAKGLNEAGHDAVHVRDIGLSSATDDEILSQAIMDSRVIVSADTDFGTLLALKNAAMPSFILFRRSDKRPLSLLNLLIDILDNIQDDLDKGAVVVIEDQRLRIRKLPITKNNI
jgi:predicted nuclease of predicted toxin-antitoxin system